MSDINIPIQKEYPRTTSEVTYLDGRRVVIDHEDSPSGHENIRRFRESVALTHELINKGEPALKRLMKIAEANASGQAVYITKFLLGLYNGPRFPFSLDNLRAIDLDLMNDALAVLEMDMKACRQEVHRYFKNGGERFEKMAFRFDESE